MALPQCFQTFGRGIGALLMDETVSQIPLVLLNYNGRALLEECLPSIVAAARASRHDCRVVIIDNCSTDDSCAFLRSNWPEIEVIVQPNRGLCSYNDVLPGLEGEIAVLLNNDIKLAADAIDPLIEPLLRSDAEGARCAMTAPRCMLFDGVTYEGLRTAVRWRWGLIQATALFPGHEAGQFTRGRTASAGAVIAVRRRLFLKLGGFDPIYLPGRIEDLDLAYRIYQSGYHAEYVPNSVTFHRGQATFGAVHGDIGCLRLALRNTFLFQWKNLRRPTHIVRHVVGVAARVASEVVRAPFVGPGRRFLTCAALIAATQRRFSARIESQERVAPRDSARERQFFREFNFRVMQHPSCAN